MIYVAPGEMLSGGGPRWPPKGAPGSDRHFFDYPRSTDGTSDPTKRDKTWIIEYGKGQG